jgi:hypothetical protein
MELKRRLEKIHSGGIEWEIAKLRCLKLGYERIELADTITRSILRVLNNVTG